MPLDFGSAADHGVRLTGGVLRFLKPVAVSFEIFEFQEIGRGKVCIRLDKRAGIDQALDSLARRDLKMVVTFWTNLKISFDDLPVDEFIAGIAFQPKIVGKFDFFPTVPFAFFLLLFLLLLTFFEPGHFFYPLIGTN